MTTRRDFLKNTMLLSAGLTVGGVNLNAAGQKRVSGANRRINLACVGIGNRGGEILNEFDKTGLATSILIFIPGPNELIKVNASAPAS